MSNLRPFLSFLSFVFACLIHPAGAEELSCPSQNMGASSLQEYIRLCEKCAIDKGIDAAGASGLCESMISMNNYCLAAGTDRCQKCGAAWPGCAVNTSPNWPTPEPLKPPTGDEESGACPTGQHRATPGAPCTAISSTDPKPPTPPSPPKPPNPVTTTPPPAAPPPTTTGNADNDQNTCSSLRNAAASACMGLSSRSAPQQQSQIQPGESMASYCQRMRTASTNANNANSSMGINCITQHTTCSSTCESLANNWASSNPSAANNLKSMAAYCRSLDSYAQATGYQGANLSNNSYYSQYCNQQTQSMPPNGGGDGGGGMGGGPGGGGDPLSPQAAAAQARAAAAAQAAKEEAEAARKASPKFDLEENKKDDFNVANSNVSQPAYSGNGELNPAIAAIKGSAGQQRTVANNTGGQIPGQGGDTNGAKLGGRGGSPGSPGYTTDVLQGFQNASGGTTPGGSTQAKEDGSGFQGYGGGRAPAEQKLDLRQYLPGGRRDPGVRLGGFRPNSLSSQIHGPSVNVWNRISMRFMEKCRLGELIDCR